ncbi:MAG: trimeric intracellular cation channel family protein [Enterocloster sp.]
MLPDINVYKILEIIGTIAFASSGAMVAVKRRLDYLGIVVLGVTTAVGGGMCRDILIGQTPPGMFLDPTNTIIAFWTVNCMFLTIRMKWSQLLHLQGGLTIS